MKPTYARRARRAKPVADAAFAKKDVQQESQFFGTSPSVAFFQPTPSIQRKCEGCAEEEKKKDMTAQDVKKAAERGADEKKEEDKKVQKKEAANPSSVAPHLPSLAGRGAPLSSSAQAFFAARMGGDFSGVRIHTGAEADASAKSLNAQAYTVGGDIVFAEGKYSPETSDGKRLLAHELAHVLQQGGGERVSRKEQEAAEEKCGQTYELEGKTNATFKKGAGKTVGEKKTKSDSCEDCPEDCITASGKLSVPYTVSTNVTLPAVPADFTPCQQKLVKAGINNIIAPHEQKHVKAFNTFAGTASLPIDYSGCDAGYSTYLEGLAQDEYDRREAAANAASDALDPFTADVDVCCKEPEKKGK